MGHRRIATSTESLTETTENQGSVHRFIVVVSLTLPRRILSRSLLRILYRDARRAVVTLPPEAVERGDSLVILVRLGISSIVIDKSEVKLIEIIPLPFLPPGIAMMTFPIGQPSSRTGPLQSLGPLELSLPPELDEHPGGLGGVGWRFDRRRRHVLP